VYSRELDGKTLTLAPSGWTYDNTFVLYDKETESLWYPNKKGLMSIQGVYFKKLLPKLKSVDTRWNKWHKKHPDTKVHWVYMLILILHLLFFIHQTSRFQSFFHYLFFPFKSVIFILVIRGHSR